ncbi:SDR family oxidoreductase [Botrimarina hoheduenensis]|uniref:UDP-glucose 4-epimerase n=1 Tax=Botrimarina hoheduenensis TaxID=2528000 RepID=A0A5C5WAT6_9BACT|nr:SDR family oxidoreductase [Botrimarina hoheduenensis]TWT47694.1 UDP-glucose 4-epimerase [Botrimarina hoheduenensis]
MTRLHLVTGGAGFIGSHLATALVERGDRVRVLDNLSTGFERNLAGCPEVELVVGDVCDPSVVDRAVQGVDTVFHEAAMASVPASMRTPLISHAACMTGTVQVLDSARRAGVRRVLIAASSAAYGDRPFAAKRETDAVEPLSPYAASKIASELYCQAFTRSFGLETVALRYFNVYGPRQDPASEYSAVIPIFVTKMLGGVRPTVFGDGQQSRDFVFIGDVVRANLLAADAVQASGQVINVATGRHTTLLDLIAAINGAMGTAVEPIFAEPRQGDVRESLADITTARQILGYEPQVSLREGLVRSIDYYRELAG